MFARHKKGRIFSRFLTALNVLIFLIANFKKAIILGFSLSFCSDKGFSPN